MPDLNIVHVRDLNFVLRSEIFFHFDEQLRAFHLILDVTPVYSNYQSYRQALTVGSPLLSYIDMRHRGFFSLRLIVGEAQDLSFRLVRVGLLVPAKDGSANTVFQGRTLHTPVEEQRTEVPTTEQVVVESVNSFGAKVEEPEEETVVRINMVVARFLLGGRPAAQQQQQTPPPPRNCKGPCKIE